MTCPEVARLPADAPRSVEYWVHRFEWQGLGGLTEGERSNRPRRLNEKQMKESGRVLRRMPSDAGMRVNLWDGKTLSGWIDQTCGIELRVWQHHRVDARAGASCAELLAAVAQDAHEPQVWRTIARTRKRHMWGIVPAAGKGSRIQPISCSKELLPVSRHRSDGEERARAVSEYLIDRLILGGATRICIVISPEKTDILQYYGGIVETVPICYAVQDQPYGLSDAVFRTLPFVPPDEDVLIGLPDTIWYPATALAKLPSGTLSLLLFPVDQAAEFDTVVTDRDARVIEVRVKDASLSHDWIWGAMKMTGAILRELHELWLARGRVDEYMGTLINAHVRKGGQALGIRAGDEYVDIGTPEGYRRAVEVFERRERQLSACAGEGPR